MVENATVSFFKKEVAKTNDWYKVVKAMYFGWNIAGDAIRVIDERKTQCITDYLESTNEADNTEVLLLDFDNPDGNIVRYCIDDSDLLDEIAIDSAFPYYVVTEKHVISCEDDFEIHIRSKSSKSQLILTKGEYNGEYILTLVSPLADEEYEERYPQKVDRQGFVDGGYQHFFHKVFPRG